MSAHITSSLSLQSSMASLHQTLLHTAVLHHGLLNLIIGPLPASFTPLLSLLKALMTLLLLCRCYSLHTSRGSPTHSDISDRCLTSTLWNKFCVYVCEYLYFWGVYACIIKQWVGWKSTFKMIPRSKTWIDLHLLFLRWTKLCCWFQNISGVVRLSYLTHNVSEIKLIWNIFSFSPFKHKLSIFKTHIYALDI